jgi:hypothetical protein
MYFFRPGLNKTAFNRNKISRQDRTRLFSALRLDSHQNLVLIQVEINHMGLSFLSFSESTFIHSSIDRSIDQLVELSTYLSVCLSVCLLKVCLVLMPKPRISQSMLDAVEEDMVKPCKNSTFLTSYHAIFLILLLKDSWWLVPCRDWSI